MTTEMSEMDWKHEPLPDSFKAFRARMQLFLDDNEITDPAKRAIKIKIAVGDEGMRRILASGLTVAQQADPSQIWTLLEQQIDVTVSVSVRVHRLEFAHLSQKSSETLIDFISRLREKSTKCDFEPQELNERLIEMVILSTQFDEFRKELLSKPKGHPIQDVITRGRQYEAIKLSQASLQEMTVTNMGVNSIRTNKSCQNCGLHHPLRACPAYNDHCHACNSMGHWKKFCRKTQRRLSRHRHNATDTNKPTARRRSKSRGKEHSKFRSRHNSQHSDRQFHEVGIQQNDSDQFTSKLFYSITISDLSFSPLERREAFTTVHVHHSKADGPLSVKLDTGAGGNTLPLRTYRQLFANTPFIEILTDESNVRLTSYSGTPLRCLGSIIFAVRKLDQNEYINQKFYVVDVPGPAVLGLPTCECLDLMKLNKDTVKQKQNANQCDVQSIPTEPTHPSIPVSSPDSDTGIKIKSIDQLKSMFPDCFDGIGNFDGEEHLYLKEDATPFIDPPRRYPIHLQSKIKHEPRQNGS